MNEAEREELRIACARVSDPFGTVTVNAMALYRLLAEYENMRLDLDVLAPLLSFLPVGERPPRRSRP